MRYKAQIAGLVSEKGCTEIAGPAEGLAGGGGEDVGHDSIGLLSFSRS